MGSGDQTAKTALLECQRVMAEINALEGPPPKEGAGIQNDSIARRFDCGPVRRKHRCVRILARG